jgi:hypothetical protein
MDTINQTKIELLVRGLDQEEVTRANERHIPEEEVDEPAVLAGPNQAVEQLDLQRNIVNQGPADPNENTKRFAARAGSWALFITPTFAGYAALGKCLLDLNCMTYAACAGAGAGVGVVTALGLAACMKCGPADCCCDELTEQDDDDQRQTTRYNESSNLLWAAQMERTKRDQASPASSAPNYNGNAIRQH